MWPTFRQDPNGHFKINDRSRPSSSSSTHGSSSNASTGYTSSSQSSSSHQGQVVRVAPRSSISTTSSAQVPVVAVVPARRPATQFTTDVRTPPTTTPTSQHFVVSPRSPRVRGSPSPDHIVEVPGPRPPPSLPPSPASVTSESEQFVPPHAPEPPSAVRYSPRGPVAPVETTLRVPPSSRRPTDLRSDPGSQKSSGSHSRPAKAHSDRGHGRKHSTSTASTSGSSSSRQSDAQTAPTTVSGASGGRQNPGLLQEPPKQTRRVRMLEQEQIEIADVDGKKRINRYRYA